MCDYMKFKRMSIIVLGLLILIFTMGVISASEDVREDTLKSNITTSDSSTDIDNQSSDNQTSPENITKKIKTKVQADEKAVKYKAKKNMGKFLSHRHCKKIDKHDKYVNIISMNLLCIFIHEGLFYT